MCLGENGMQVSSLIQDICKVKFPFGILFFFKLILISDIMAGQNHQRLECLRLLQISVGFMPLWLQDCITAVHRDRGAIAMATNAW